MINARIAGTAIHLNLNQDNSEDSSQISYKKYQVWGIKTLIKYLVGDIFNIIYDNLPKREELLKTEKLLKPLKVLCKRYSIPYKRVLNYIDLRKEPKQIWEPLDTDLKAIFIINAFFEAFEENLVDSYYQAINLSRFLWLIPKIKPKLNRSDFGLKDFGFIFRARGYSSRYSKKVSQDGFHNTVKRLNKVLYKEYKNTFIKGNSNKANRTKIKTIDVEKLPPEKQYIIKLLRKGNTEEKLKAIKLVIKNRINEAVDDLEFLLKKEDDRVMNAALDAIIILKNLD
jgi:hypothetical protein